MAGGERVVKAFSLGMLSGLERIEELTRQSSDAPFCHRLPLMIRIIELTAQRAPDERSHRTGGRVARSLEGVAVGSGRQGLGCPDVIRRVRNMPRDREVLFTRLPGEFLRLGSDVGQTFRSAVDFDMALNGVQDPACRRRPRR